jgi:hypothetical protein
MIYDEMKWVATQAFSWGWDGISAGMLWRDHSAAFVHMYHRMEVKDKLSFCAIALLFCMWRSVVSSAVDVRVVK